MKSAKSPETLFCVTYIITFSPLIHSREEKKKKKNLILQELKKKKFRDLRDFFSRRDWRRRRCHRVSYISLNLSARVGNEMNFFFLVCCLLLLGIRPPDERQDRSAFSMSILLLAPPPLRKRCEWDRRISDSSICLNNPSE